MKKILMAAVALICMTMTSAILAACGSDEKTEINPNRSLGPISLGDIKVFSCSPESKECLSLVHRSYKT